MREYEYDISICGSANQINFWKEMYKRYMKNSVSIEVVFVGDKYPSYKLPSNFKFIYSEVKPAQCCEIATRNCGGKYIYHTADDFYYEKGHFDNILSFYKDKVDELKTDKIITGGIHFFGNNSKRKIIKLWSRKMLPNRELPLDTFICNKHYKEMGGVDRNFVSIYFNFDIIMRFMQSGGQCIISNYKFREKHLEDRVEITSRVKHVDKPLFKSLWWCKYGENCKNETELKKSGIPYWNSNDRGFIPKHRRKEVELFNDKDILTISQGAVCDKWEINNE